MCRCYLVTHLSAVEIPTFYFNTFLKNSYLVRKYGFCCLYFPLKFFHNYLRGLDSLFSLTNMANKLSSSYQTSFLYNLSLSSMSLRYSWISLYHLMQQLGFDLLNWPFFNLKSWFIHINSCQQSLARDYHWRRKRPALYQSNHQYLQN